MISPSKRLRHFHRSCGYLFPHTHPHRLPKMSSISDSGHHIPIPGTVVWPFSSTLGILQDYDRDQMLVHVMGINLCQYLDDWLIYSPSYDQCLHDNVQVLNLCHTMGRLIHDKKSELIPNRNSFSGIPVGPSFLSQNQALICSFLLSQGGCAHTWQILLGLFASTEKMVPLGRLHTREAQHCISQHWDFNVLTSNLWIPLSPMAEEDFQWWKSAHNVLRGAPVTPTNQTLSCSWTHRTSAGEHIGMH